MLLSTRHNVLTPVSKEEERSKVKSTKVLSIPSVGALLILESFPGVLWNGGDHELNQCVMMCSNQLEGRPGFAD